MSRKIPTVAIVGRTNVGKSSLFNALIGHRVAVVEDQPGVTRDRNYAHVKRYAFPFTIVDTGGIIGEEHGQSLHRVVREQTELAIAESDLIIAMFDGAYGVHPLDSSVVEILRRSNRPVLWVVNKTESPTVVASVGDFYQLGIDEVHCIAAAHRAGLKELVQAIGDKLGVKPEDQFEERPSADQIIRVAILGKPNVGKSSIVNRLAGFERVVAADLPGSTTDNIDVEVVRDGQRYVFVDTAGLRREKNVKGSTVERYSNLRTLRALAQCDVAVMVIDGKEGATDQDIRIAELVHERGRGLIFVVNKWDLVEKDNSTVHKYTEALYKYFRFAQYAPVIFSTATTGRRCSNILEKAREIAKSAEQRIPTSELNRILNHAFEHRPPPVYRGEPVRLYFSTQVSVSPPTIIIFANYPARVTDAYQRYLKNAIRESFPFHGIDIKLSVRKRTEKDQRKRDAKEQGAGVRVDEKVAQIKKSPEIQEQDELIDEDALLDDEIAGDELIAEEDLIDSTIDGDAVEIEDKIEDGTDRDAAELHHKHYSGLQKSRAI